MIGTPLCLDFLINCKLSLRNAKVTANEIAINLQTFSTYKIHTLACMKSKKKITESPKGHTLRRRNNENKEEKPDLPYLSKRSSVHWTAKCIVCCTLQKPRTKGCTHQSERHFSRSWDSSITTKNK